MPVPTHPRGRILFAGIGTILVVVLVILLGPKRTPVELGSVSRGPLRVTVESEGRTRIRNIYAVSAPVAGQLQRVTLKAGDPVRTGETVLAEIRQPNPDFLDVRSVAERRAKIDSALAQRELARAEVRRAAASLEYARADLKRNEALVAKRFVSTQSLDKSRLEVRTKEAELAVAEKDLQSREADLKMNQALLLSMTPTEDATKGNRTAKVIAETTGKVLRVLQESELFVKSGTPILEIGDPTDLEVLLEMLSENAAKVRVGAETTLTGWGGKTLQGRVRRVEPYGFIKVSALGIEEQRVNVLIDLVSPIDEWQAMEHGYRVDAQIVVWGRDDVLRVPMGALFRDTNEWAVFRLDAAGVIELRHVRIGQSNNAEAELLDGLSEGDRVVLHPSDRLRSGMPVIAEEGKPG